MITVWVVRVVEIIPGERLDIQVDILGVQTMRDGGIETVDDVQVMGPDLGPVFP